METQTTLAQINNSLKDIQWRWIFGAAFAVLGTIQIVMFLIISIYVARNSVWLLFEGNWNNPAAWAIYALPAIEFVFGLLIVLLSKWTKSK